MFSRFETWQWKASLWNIHTILRYTDGMLAVVDMAVFISGESRLSTHCSISGATKFFGNLQTSVEHDHLRFHRQKTFRMESFGKRQYRGRRACRMIVREGTVTADDFCSCHPLFLPSCYSGILPSYHGSVFPTPCQPENLGI